MSIPFQDFGIMPTDLRGPRARTNKLMLETAIGLMQNGLSPSVSDVATAAGVSRATAYRYFPSQAAMVHAAVDYGLGPILEWHMDSEDVEARIADLLETSMPRISTFEATFKSALRLSLEQWARRQAGTLGTEPAFKRGHRIELLKQAIEPLRGKLSDEGLDRLAKALSLVYGLEVLLVLKDIWGLGADEVRNINHWAARALIRAAIEEEAGGAQTP